MGGRAGLLRLWLCQFTPLIYIAILIQSRITYPFQQTLDLNLKIISYSTMGLIIYLMREVSSQVQFSICFKATLLHRTIFEISNDQLIETALPQNLFILAKKSIEPSIILKKRLNDKRLVNQFKYQNVTQPVGYNYTIKVYSDNTCSELLCMSDQNVGLYYCNHPNEARLVHFKVFIDIQEIKDSLSRQINDTPFKNTLIQILDQQSKEQNLNKQVSNRLNIRGQIEQDILLDYSNLNSNNYLNVQTKIKKTMVVNFVLADWTLFHRDNLDLEVSFVPNSEESDWKNLLPNIINQYVNDSEQLDLKEEFSFLKICLPLLHLSDYHITFYQTEIPHGRDGFHKRFDKTNPPQRDLISDSNLANLLLIIPPQVAEVYFEQLCSDKQNFRNIVSKCKRSKEQYSSLKPGNLLVVENDINRDAIPWLSMHTKECYPATKYKDLMLMAEAYKQTQAKKQYDEEKKKQQQIAQYIQGMMDGKWWMLYS